MENHMFKVDVVHCKPHRQLVLTPEAVLLAAQVRLTRAAHAAAVPCIAIIAATGEAGAGWWQVCALLVTVGQFGTGIVELRCARIYVCETHAGVQQNTEPIGVDNLCQKLVKELKTKHELRLLAYIVCCCKG